MITSLARTTGMSAARQDASRTVRDSAKSFRNQIDTAALASASRAGDITNASGRSTGSVAATAKTVTAPRQSGATVASTTKAAPLMSTAGASTTAASTVTKAATAATTSTTAPASFVSYGNPVPFPGYGVPGEFTLATMNSLTQALQAAGINPNSLNMIAHDDVATYPTGAYQNRTITVLANGHVENFSADLTAINPNVAVVEIKRLLSMA